VGARGHPLGDVAHGGADTIGGRGAAGVVCVRVGAVDVEEGDGARPGPLGRGPDELWSSVLLGDVARGWCDNGTGGGAGIVVALALCAMEVCEPTAEVQRQCGTHQRRWGPWVTWHLVGLLQPRRGVPRGHCGLT